MATSSTRLQRAVVTVLLPLLLACLGPPTTIHVVQGLDSTLTTNFSCIGKVIGGYYADQYTNCQMFHVCTLDEKGKINDYTFRCLAGTVFDQETRVCERSEEVDCSRSQSFFHLNDELYGPGIIPSTADSEGDSSAANVQVLDPTVALMGATAPPTIPTDTEEATTSPPPQHSTSTSTPETQSQPQSQSTPRPQSHSQSQLQPQSQSQPQLRPQPQSQVQSHAQSQAQSHPHAQSHAQFQAKSQVQFQSQTQTPTTISLPVTDNPSEVTAPTSTSAPVTSANPFPPLPFTVSRTSTSVSSSSRVHIQTPLAQISLNQGVDNPVLPAPHLRPSLLRLAAEAQNAGHQARIIKQLSPSTESSVTPANFRDVPRISILHLDTSGAGTPHSSNVPPRHRQKRQSTLQGPTLPTTFSRDAEALFADLTTSSRLTNSDQLPPSASSSRRISSRGRSSFRQPSRDQSRTVTQQAVQSRTSVGRQRQGGGRVASFVDRQPQRRQRVRPVGRVSVARRPVTTSQARSSPSTASFSHQVRIGAATPVQSRPVPSTAPRDFPRSPVIPLGPVDIPRQTPFPSGDLPHEPPTVLTAQFPSDSHITVIDEVEATARTDISARTPDQTSSTTTTITTTTTPSPQFVFPETSFSCIDKIHGGLYADVETGCKVFHICSVEPDKSAKSNKFTCGPGTLFDQKSRTCQVESAVDCPAAPTFYYLNERGNLPVFVDREVPNLEQQFPEQVFDFPRIPSSPTSPSLSTSRARRSADESVDLCASRPLGSPLADITSGCRHYSTCEKLADGRLVETRHGCKKDMLFSQQRKRCMLAKKVDCVKETLSEILGLGTAMPSSGNGRKRRAAALLLSHRFRRAALPSLVNMVGMPEVEDAQVRRALMNLAALQQWSLENARHSTFVELYSLQNGNRDTHLPMRTNTNTLSDSEAPKGSDYVLRRKRDLSNITVEGQVVFVNHSISQVTGSFSTAMPASQESLNGEETNPEEDISRVTFTGTLALPTIATTTIGQRLKTSAAMEGAQHDETQSAAAISSPSSPPAIPTTLSTLTVSGMPTTATATVITVTVTTTKTVLPTSINLASAVAAFHSTAAVTSNSASVQSDGEAIPGMMATPVLDNNGKNGSPETEASDNQSSKEDDAVTDRPAAFTTLCMIMPPPKSTGKKENASPVSHNSPKQNSTGKDTTTTTTTSTSTTTTESDTEASASTIPSITSSTTSTTPSSSSTTTDTSSTTSGATSTTPSTTSSSSTSTTTPSTTSTTSSTSTAPGTTSSTTSSTSSTTPSTSSTTSSTSTTPSTSSTTSSTSSTTPSTTSTTSSTSTTPSTSSTSPSTSSTTSSTSSTPTTTSTTSSTSTTPSTSSTTSSTSSTTPSTTSTTSSTSSTPSTTSTTSSTSTTPSTSSTTSSTSSTTPSTTSTTSSTSTTPSTSSTTTSTSSTTPNSSSTTTTNSTVTVDAAVDGTSTTAAVADNTSTTAAASTTSIHIVDPPVTTPESQNSNEKSDLSVSKNSVPASESANTTTTSTTTTTTLSTTTAAAAAADDTTTPTTTSNTTTENLLSSSSTTPSTTTTKIEETLVESVAEQSAPAASDNSTSTSSTTTTTTIQSVTDFVVPAGSINVSTTVVPDKTSNTTNSSSPSPTEPSVIPNGPFTSETLPETNFTCKNKELEQFYPDPEANCQVFHYCLPGFLKKQVLDLKFLCTGATKFDVKTQKCEDMETVTCGEEESVPEDTNLSSTITTTTTSTAASPTTTTNETSTTDSTLPHVEHEESITETANATTTTSSTTTTPTTTSSTTTPTSSTTTTPTTTSSTTTTTTTTTPTTTTTTTSPTTVPSIPEAETTSSKIDEVTLTILKPENATTEHTTLKLEEAVTKHTNWNTTKHETHENETKPEETIATVTHPPETTLEPVIQTEAPQIEEENTEKIATQEENTEKINTQEENIEKINTQDENIEKINTQEENTEKIDIQVENTEKIDIQEENTEESDIPSSTPFIPIEEYATETEIPDTELVAEQDKYPSTETPVEAATAVETIPEMAPDPEHVTELGPMMRSEDIHGLHTTEGKSSAESSTEVNVEISMFSTTLGPSVPTQESSTDMSVSTDVSAVSSDFVSSATQVSSDVSVSSSTQSKEDAS